MTRMPKPRSARVIAGPSMTTALVHQTPKTINVHVHNPACLTTAPIEEMARRVGTTIVVSLTRRQLVAWLNKEAA
jgi:hypothetical protein